MIIHLDCTLAELMSLSQTSVEHSISSLLRSHREGFHVAVIARPLADGIAAQFNLITADAAMLSRVAASFTQTGDLIRRAHRYIRVIPHSERVEMIGNAVTLGLNLLQECRILDRPALLVENIARDGLFYGEAVKNHYDLVGCPRPNYEVVHGGGADLATVFERQIDYQKIVCALIDSDRNAPSADECPKLARLEKLSRDKQWPLAFAFSPPCREAENCLPPDLVMTLPSGVGNKSNEVLIAIADRETAAGVHGSEAFWLFFDLKEGLTTEKIRRLTRQAEIDWIATKLSYVGLTIDNVSIGGYGERLFDQLANGPHLAALRALTRENRWREVFASFLEQIIWVLVGGKRVVT